jgi:hypothetical protein
MAGLTLDQEQQVSEALVAIGWMETEQSLSAGGIVTIQRVLGCSANQAQNILDDFQDRNLIKMDITRGGELDARKPMPVAHWRWVRPLTNES